MPVFSGLRKQTYRVNPDAFAKGGEGSIHQIEGMPNYVAKIYSPNRIEGRSSKLLFMASQPGADQLQYIAWPYDVLKNENGMVVGFVMKRIGNTKDLSVLLPQKDDGIMTWRKRVRVAINLCDVVREVHSMGQCIGDMNPNNFGVDMSNGHVYAFDADSFHIHEPDGRYYPCVVKREEYCAPELQRLFHSGMDMRTISPSQTFTENTDRFALAVLIFQLLFNGFHPFSARPAATVGSSTIVTRRDENILNGVSPYFNPSANIRILEDAPGLHIIPDKLQEMFRMAFFTQNRPSAMEWQRKLFDLDECVTICACGHYYWWNLSDCPWCALEQKNSPAKQRPPTPPTPPTSSTPFVPPPTPPVTKKKKSKWWLWVLLLLILLGQLVEQGGLGWFSGQDSMSPNSFVEQVITEQNKIYSPQAISKLNGLYKQYAIISNGEFFEYCSSGSGNGIVAEANYVTINDQPGVSFWAAGSGSPTTASIHTVSFECAGLWLDEDSGSEKMYQAFLRTVLTLFPIGQRSSVAEAISFDQLQQRTYLSRKIGSWYIEITNTMGSIPYMYVRLFSDELF